MRPVTTRMKSRFTALILKVGLCLFINLPFCNPVLMFPPSGHNENPDVSRAHFAFDLDLEMTMQ
ncbi:MAG: hypothetical protein JWO20_2508 [Candidatus Angelobacter sp.]|nr:hypothetical protein [Candidatus Angelobacter sp.]